MQKILLLAGCIAFFGAAVYAQSPRVVTCIVDAGTTAANGKQVANWRPREGIREAFEITPGEQVVMPFAMPAEDKCEGHVLTFTGRHGYELPSLSGTPGKTFHGLWPSVANVIIIDRSGIEARNRKDSLTTTSPCRF